jgi:hypothetical protein
MDIVRAVADASSWSEVLLILGVNNNGDALVRIRGHAARLGLDVAHLSRQRSRPPIDDLVQPPRPRSLRAAATSIAAAWFTLHGYSTSVPVEPEVYDLLVALPSGIQRVQVKSSTCRLSNGKWQVQIGRRPYTPEKSAARAPYDPDVVDFFFVVTLGGSLYLIPSRAVAGLVSICVDGYPEYRVGDCASLLR